MFACLQGTEIKNVQKMASARDVGVLVYLKWRILVNILTNIVLHGRDIRDE